MIRNSNSAPYWASEVHSTLSLLFWLIFTFSFKGVFPLLEWWPSCERFSSFLSSSAPYWISEVFFSLTVHSHFHFDLFLLPAFKLNEYFGWLNPAYFKVLRIFWIEFTIKNVLEFNFEFCRYTHIEYFVGLSLGKANE